MEIKMKVYEEPMCCSSGVCGPDVDDELVEFSDTIKKLEKEGVKVERNAMNHNPLAFQQNKSVLNMVNNEGTNNLPITELNGKVVKLGEYPSLEELKEEIDNLKEVN